MGYLDKMSSMTANTRTVRPEETMQGQMSGLLAKDSPFLQQSRSRAAQGAKARGLQNTTMAATAGESAALDAAAPIAQFDAGVYGTEARDNQSFLNRAAEFNAGASNQFGMQDVQNEQGIRLQELQGKQRLGEIGASGEQDRLGVAARGAESLRLQEAQSAARQGEIASQGRESRETQVLQDAAAMDRLEMDAQTRQLISSNNAATEMWRSYMAATERVANNPNLDQAAKDASIMRMRQDLSGGLALAGSVANVDYGGLLDFGAGAGVIPTVQAPVASQPQTESGVTGNGIQLGSDL